MALTDSTSYEFYQVKHSCYPLAMQSSRFWIRDGAVAAESVLSKLVGFGSIKGDIDVLVKPIILISHKLSNEAIIIRTSPQPNFQSNSENQPLSTMPASLLTSLYLALCTVPSFVITAPIGHLYYNSKREVPFYFAAEYVYPNHPAEAKKSTYVSKVQLSAWRDLTLFLGVLSLHPELKGKVFDDLSSEQLLSLAPTNRAFIAFFAKFGHVFNTGLCVLN